jgi:hypothetical protein
MPTPRTYAKASTKQREKYATALNGNDRATNHYWNWLGPFLTTDGHNWARVGSLESHSVLSVMSVLMIPIAASEMREERLDFNLVARSQRVSLMP